MSIRKRLLCSAAVLSIAATWTGTVEAVTIVGAPNVASGGIVPANTDVAIYSVRLEDPPQDLVSIAVRIDGAGPDPISAGDIDRLSLWADTTPPFPGNGILEATDVFIGEQLVVPLGVMVTVSDPVPTGTIALGPGPNAKWFFVGVRFNSSAAGKYFTVRATTPPDNIVAFGPPGPPGFKFASGPVGPGAPVHGQPEIVPILEAPIPVGYEWVAGLGFFACGVYGLMRARRRRAQQG